MRIISGKSKGTKLYTLEGNTTRPTLDRVKESIFNIIQNRIQESIFLDLFSGSGAIGLEAISRGAKKAILCDLSKQAINIIQKNIDKTHSSNQVELYNIDFKILLNTKIKEKIDIIYLDPPYKSNFIQEAVQIIIEKDLLKDNGIIIIETEDENRIIDNLKNERIQIVDRRKYGRAHVIFYQKNNIEEYRGG